MIERTKPKPALLVGAVVAVVLLALGAWWLVSSADSDSDDADSRARYTPATATATTATASPDDDATTATATPRAVTPRPAGSKGRPLTDPVRLADGATARVTKVERVRSRAQLPGEISAPALRFTVEVTAGDEAVDLAPVVVNAYYGPDRTPAIAMTEPGGTPFAGRLAAGKSATGAFVFNVPPRERGQVHLEFSWSAKRKPVVLSGNVS